MTGEARYQITVDSPVGPLVLTASEAGIVALTWAEEGQRIEQRPNALLETAAAQLRRYFEGGPGSEAAGAAGFDLPLAPAGTDFQKRGWRAMAAIPAGEIESYGALAKRLNTAPRAVGGLCASNPIPIIVPCHRVVGAGGTLGGFSGGVGLDTKRWLLRHEGALEPQLI